jgi:hypothetical protein
VGRVVTRLGEPAAGASITVRNAAFAKTVQSAADGTFALLVPQPPAWNLAVFARDATGEQQAAFIRDESAVGNSPIGSVRLVLDKARELAPDQYVLFVARSGQAISCAWDRGFSRCPRKGRT